MRDKYDDQVFQALRHDFADSVAAIFESITYTLGRLHAQLYDAPWSRQAEPDRCTGRSTIV